MLKNHMIIFLFKQQHEKHCLLPLFVSAFALPWPLVLFPRQHCLIQSPGHFLESTIHGQRVLSSHKDASTHCSVRAVCAVGFTAAQTVNLTPCELCVGMVDLRRWGGLHTFIYWHERLWAAFWTEIKQGLDCKAWMQTCISTEDECFLGFYKENLGKMLFSSKFKVLRKILS